MLQMQINIWPYNQVGLGPHGAKASVLILYPGTGPLKNVLGNLICILYMLHTTCV